MKNVFLIKSHLRAMRRNPYSHSRLEEQACPAKSNTLLFLILVLLTVRFASAQELANIAGAFVDIGFGARPMGLGGAYIAVADDADALFWNPAGVAALNGQVASFFYTRQFNLIPYTFAAYANGMPDKNWGHSEALLVSGDDALRETTLLFSVAYDLDLLVDGLKIGATFKYKNATFGNNPNGGEGQVRGSAVGLGMDIGALCPLSSKFTAGLVLKNLFDFLSWNSSAMGMYSQGSPLRLLGGIAMRPGHNLLISVDLEKSLYSDTRDRLSVGVEKRIFNMLAFRSGVFQNMVAAADMNYNFGFGFQYALANNVLFAVDAAYLVQEINNSLRFSFTVRF